MRHLVTFILRLWVSAEEASCEGEVECVATGERRHVRKQEDVARFVETRIGLQCEGAAQTAKDEPSQE